MTRFKVNDVVYNKVEDVKDIDSNSESDVTAGVSCEWGT